MSSRRPIISPDVEPGPMTPDEAARWLGWGHLHRPGRKFIRQALAREQALGRQFMVRRPTIDGRTLYTVTATMIEREMPDYLERRTARVARGVGAQLGKFEARVRAEVESRLRHHAARLDQLEGELADLQTKNLHWLTALENALLTKQDCSKKTG